MSWRWQNYIEEVEREEKIFELIESESFVKDPLFQNINRKKEDVGLKVVGSKLPELTVIAFRDTDAQEVLLTYAKRMASLVDDVLLYVALVRDEIGQIWSSKIDGERWTFLAHLRVVSKLSHVMTVLETLLVKIPQIMDKVVDLRTEVQLFLDWVTEAWVGAVSDEMERWEEHMDRHARNVSRITLDMFIYNENARDDDEKQKHLQNVNAWQTTLAKANDMFDKKMSVAMSARMKFQNDARAWPIEAVVVVGSQKRIDGVVSACAEVVSHAGVDLDDLWAGQEHRRERLAECERTMSTVYDAISVRFSGRTRKC